MRSSDVVAWRHDSKAAQPAAPRWQTVMQPWQDCRFQEWVLGVCNHDDRAKQLDPNQERFYAALTALGHEGREGKGSLILFCNGNDGAQGFQSMLDNNLNSTSRRCSSTKAPATCRQ